MGLRARLDASEKRSLVHTGNGTNYMGTEWIELVGMKSDVFLCRRHWAVTLRKMLGPFLPDCIILTFSTCCVSWCLSVARRLLGPYFGIILVGLTTEQEQCECRWQRKIKQIHVMFHCQVVSCTSLWCRYECYLFLLSTGEGAKYWLWNVTTSSETLVFTRKSTGSVLLYMETVWQLEGLLEICSVELKYF